MRFTITSQGTGIIPLQLDISGYHISVSDMAAGSISVSDADGRLAVCFTEPQAVTVEAVAAQVQAILPESDTVPIEQVSEVDDVSQTEVSDIEVGSTGNSQPVEDVDRAIRQAVATLKAEVAEIIDSEQLFKQLVAVRKQLASELRLPPYIIFHDKTLRDMCRLLPTDLSELSDIQGVGQSKLEKYGSKFIQSVQEYLARLKEAA